MNAREWKALLARLRTEAIEKKALDRKRKRAGYSTEGWKPSEAQRVPRGWAAQIEGE